MKQLADAAHRSLHDPAFAALVDCLTAALLRDDLTLDDVYDAALVAHARLMDMLCTKLEALSAALAALRPSDTDPGKECVDGIA